MTEAHSGLLAIPHQDYRPIIRFLHSPQSVAVVTDICNVYVNIRLVEIQKY